MGKRNTIHCRSRSCANCFGNSHASVTPSGCLEPQSQLATHVRRRGPTPRNDAGRRFFADETCNHHAAACSSLPGRCLRARRTRPPPQQRPLGVTEACLFTKQLVQDRLLQWISLFLPSVPTNVQGRLAAQTGPAERSLSHASRHTSCFRDASISASPTCSITYESRAYLGCGNTRTRD